MTQEWVFPRRTDGRKKKKSLPLRTEENGGRGGKGGSPGHQRMGVVGRMGNDDDPKGPGFWAEEKRHLAHSTHPGIISPPCAEILLSRKREKHPVRRGHFSTAGVSFLGSAELVTQTKG